MQLLLDTQTFLWWLLGDIRLSRAARTAITDGRNGVFVSAASSWEIATKHRIGRLPDAAPLLGKIAEHIAGQGFAALDVTVQHGERAGALPGPHRDPFDRMLAAQAQSARLTLVSNDRVFDAYGVARFW